MVLSIIDLLNGLFSLAAVMFSIFFAAIIGARYFKLKKSEFLYMAGVCVALISPWWPHAVSFIYTMTTGIETGLPPVLYFFLGTVMIPFGVFMWLKVYTKLVQTKRPKLILTIGVLYLIFYEIALYFMLAFNPSWLGYLVPPVSVHYWYGLYAIYMPGVLIALITSINFCLVSMKSDLPDIKLRGKLILLGLIVLFTGALIAAFLSMIVVFLIVSRVLIVLAGALLYAGLIMPKLARKIFRIKD